MSDGCICGNCTCGNGIQIEQYSASAENLSAAEVEVPIFESYNNLNNEWKIPQSVYPYTDGSINE